MIFVSVGTHEQGFSRLVSEVDALKKEGIIKDEVFIQAGYTKFETKDCQVKGMLSYEEMIEKVAASRIYITHGGAASIFLGWQYHKAPIVVPRMRRYGEHVDDHQVYFVKRLEAAHKVIPVYDIKELKNAILNYESLSAQVADFSASEESRRTVIHKLDEYCLKVLNYKETGDSH